MVINLCTSAAADWGGVQQFTAQGSTCTHVCVLMFVCRQYPSYNILCTCWIIERWPTHNITAASSAGAFDTCLYRYRGKPSHHYTQTRPLPHKCIKNHDSCDELAYGTHVTHIYVALLELREYTDYEYWVTYMSTYTACLPQRTVQMQAVSGS